MVIVTGSSFVDGTAGGTPPAAILQNRGFWDYGGEGFQISTSGAKSFSGGGLLGGVRI